MRLLCLQQVDYEDPAAVAEWARLCGHQLECCLLSVGEPAPELSGYDGLVVLGGPMNIYQDDLHPWLETEKQLLREAIDQKMPVLGICLGAQLLADVLGAPTTQNRYPEIGWHRMTFTEEARRHPLFTGYPESLHVMQWHSDTFALPEGAVAVGHSEGCQHQGFIAGDNLVGLQGHLEWGPEHIEHLLARNGEVLEHAAMSPYIQSPEVIRNGEHVGPNMLMFRLCDRLFGGRND